MWDQDCSNHNSDSVPWAAALQGCKEDYVDGGAQGVKEDVDGCAQGGKEDVDDRAQGGKGDGVGGGVQGCKEDVDGGIAEEGVGTLGERLTFFIYEKKTHF